MTPIDRAPDILQRRLRPSTDRWLVSYADFVTLLFALFVVLFAVARNERASAKQLAESFQQAMGKRPAPVTPPPANELSSAFERLQEQLAPEIAAGKMKVAFETRGVVITLREGAFFPSGSDGLNPAAYESMAKVAAVLHALPNAIRLEGHTDSVPIKNGRFHSNWELSAARSIAALSYFESNFGLSPDRFSISGYADNLPVGDNESEDGRAQNRRVDVVIVSAPH
ncbi:MAG: OmpA family protein [Ignavibacteriota bacterium]